MKHTFYKLQAHPKCPDLWGWYIGIRKEDIELYFDIHQSVSQGNFMKFHLDPHMFDQKTWEPKHEGADFYNPVRLSASWLASTMRAYEKHDIIYVNRNGGFQFDPVIILDQFESDKIRFPPDSDELKNSKHRIDVLRWTDGKHFYLKSNQQFIFSQSKYDTVEDALEEARRYAPEDNIQVKDTKYVYRHEGD